LLLLLLWLWFNYCMYHCIYLPIIWTKCIIDLSFMCICFCYFIHNCLLIFAGRKKLWLSLLF
jgi:hypothetical protein